jgi:DNA-binding transcriptional LysR family regulator
MEMDPLTLDQFAVFVAVVDEGSFTAAARRLNRAQSAITYAIQRLEDGSGVELFDRSAYRPSPTEAGRALLPRARRILEDVGEFRLQADSLVKGQEAQISLVVDTYTPEAFLAAKLKAFHQAFPLVQIRISVEFHDAVLKALRDGSADLGLLGEFRPPTAEFERKVCAEIDLVPVAAHDHPLAALKGPFEPELLRDHVQIVLVTRSQSMDERDYGVHSVTQWRVTELTTKRALLLAGLGWGSMPRTAVAADIAERRLLELQPTRWEGSDRMPRFSLVVAHRRDKALGPAGRWLVQHLRAAESEGVPCKPPLRSKP